MPKMPRPPRAAVALPLLFLLGSAPPAVAQTAGATAAPAHPGHPSLPPGPLGSGPLGANMGSGDYLVTSAANERGSYLWVVDAVQRTVMLCEKTDATKEFSCVKRPLP